MRQKPFKGKEASVYLTFYEQEPGQGSYLETKKSHFLRERRTFQRVEPRAMENYPPVSHP